MAVVHSLTSSEKSLLSVLASKSAFLKTRELQALEGVKTAELELKVAEGKLKLSRKKHSVYRLEWEVLQLQIAHSRCARHERECRGDVPNEDPASGDRNRDRNAQAMQLPESRQADVSRMEPLLAGAELEEGSNEAALESLRGALIDAQEQLEKLEEAGRQLKQQQQLLETAHEHCASRVSGNVLPESVLLEIFRYLPPLTLLQVVGRVCSTWRRVSRDMSLWRDGILWLDKDSVPSDIFTLRWAPSLHKIRVIMSEHLPWEVHVALLEREFVPNLWVRLSGGPTAILLGVLRKHQDHLRTLTLDCEAPVPYPQDLWKLWLVVRQLNLRKLKISWSENYLLKTKSNADFSKLCLEKLVISESIATDSGVVPDILYSSRESLKKVFFSGSFGPLVFERLGSCCNLRTVRAPFQDGITHLESCKKIEELALCDDSVSFYTDDFPEEGHVLLEHLSSAAVLPCLRKLEIFIADRNLDRNRVQMNADRISQMRPAVKLDLDLDD